MAAGRLFKPGKGLFRAGGGLLGVVPARNDGYLGRRWQQEGSSSPGKGYFGPEVVCWIWFWPVMVGIRAGGGRREAGRETLWGPGVVRGVIVNTPSSKNELIRRLGCRA